MHWQDLNSLAVNFSRFLLESPILVLRWPIRILPQPAETTRGGPGKPGGVADEALVRGDSEGHSIRNMVWQLTDSAGWEL